MKLSNFNFPFNRNLIAQYPIEEKDKAKLMIVDKKSESIKHDNFSSLPDLFEEGDVIVYNDSKVFPALLRAYKDRMDSPINILLLREINSSEYLWDSIVDPARKVRVGNKIIFGKEGKLTGEIIDNTASRGRIIQFIWEGDTNFYDYIFSLGENYIPSILDRKIDYMDKENLQTIFAEKTGSILPCGAGLNFTLKTKKLLELKGVSVIPITLHVSLALSKKNRYGRFSKV